MFGRENKNKNENNNNNNNSYVMWRRMHSVRSCLWLLKRTLEGLVRINADATRMVQNVQLGTFLDISTRNQVLIRKITTLLDDVIANSIR